MKHVSIHASMWASVLLTTACGLVPQKPERRGTAIATQTTITTLPSAAESVPNAQRPEAQAVLRGADEHGQSINTTAASERVSAEITLKKSEILNRTFLYGFDLQYSSTGDTRLSLLSQSMAIGHVPATFRQLGDKLQLIADNRRLFESVVNHPETLVNEYKIVAETPEELTITMDRAGMLVHKTMNGAEAPAPISTWLRSLEFVEDGNYLLQETALMTQNGEVQTFLESVFPRDTLVPNDYKGIEDSRDANELASRFMFISNERVFVERGQTNGVPVRQQTAFANRFRLPTEQSTIDWYVTANTPDELMKEMRSGIEGWNRYFRDQLGRDVVLLKGRLPAGVKLGDPRYNVINFDSVAAAGAAYESQAADPLTGIQSHSVIYMPYAWYNIAANLSSARELPVVATKVGPKSPEVLFGIARDVVRCAREANEAAEAFPHALAVSAATDEDAARVVDEFGRRVFISTLFHEMGHALGLGHNFKGSLSFDGSRPESQDNPTTHSVMDYNYYQHEVDLVGDIGTSEGPRLEYDRQIISLLYNDSKDIKTTDRVIPSCNDEDADSKEGGVDPNCIRYDAESNPVVGLEHALGRLVDGGNARGIESLTLSQAIDKQRDRLIAILADTAKTPNGDAAKKHVAKMSKGLSRLIGYYISDGAQSVRVNLALNSVALRTWRSSPADDGIAQPENDRRRIYLDALKNTLVRTELPTAPAASLNAMQELVTAVIVQNSRFGSTEERAQLAAGLSASISDSAIQASKTSFAKIRNGLAAKLAYDPELSFASFVHEGQTVEQIAVSHLARLVVQDLSVDDLGVSTAALARDAAAKALLTYAKLGDDYASEIEAVRSQLKVIRNAARQAGRQDVVDHVRALLASLAD